MNQIRGSHLAQDRDAGPRPPAQLLLELAAPEERQSRFGGRAPLEGLEGQERVLARDQVADHQDQGPVRFQIQAPARRAAIGGLEAFQVDAVGHQDPLPRTARQPVHGLHQVARDAAPVPRRPQVRGQFVSQARFLRHL